jgi:histidyl-tRNA synthetase
MGIERIVALLEGSEFAASQDHLPHVYLIAMGDAAEMRSLVFAEELRTQLPNLRLITNCGGGNFKKQFKKADRSGAQWAIILAEDEVNQGTVGIKFLREHKDQLQLPQSAVVEFLREQMTKSHH